MVRIKSMFIGFIVCLCFIVLLQNTQVVGIRFLFWETSMSRILLFPLLMAMGFIAGVILSKRRRKK